MLCTGEAGEGVTGSNADAATCMSLEEATALNKIWYGATAMEVSMPRRAPMRGGKSLGTNQLWWTFTKSTGIGGQITSASAYGVALALQDVRYAADASTTSAIPITNGSTTVRNKWLELDYAGLADAVNKGVALQPTLFSNLITDKADLAKLRDLGRKVIVYTGPRRRFDPACRQHQLSRARRRRRWAGMPRCRSSCGCICCRARRTASQGRAYTVGGKNDAVPLPKLAG